MCPICMESDGEVVYHPGCSHTFHSKCLEKWHLELNRQGQNPCCPVCRQPVHADMVVVVFSETKGGEILMDAERMYFKYKDGRIHATSLPVLETMQSNIVSHCRGQTYKVRKISRSSNRVFMSSSVTMKGLMDALKLYTLRPLNARQRALLVREMKTSTLCVEVDGVVYSAQAYLQEIAPCPLETFRSSVLLKDML